MVDTILITGIHREELGFGDRVAALLDTERIHVMRIPHGISHARTGTDNLFYYNTRHREIYLQLWQQMNGHYGLLIDLHCGLNKAGRCADVYCRDERLLKCVSKRESQSGINAPIRMVKILADSEASEAVTGFRDVAAGARTLIPEQIWNDQSLSYVGLEIYLAEEGVGVDEDWRFARDLIEAIRVCGLKNRYPA